jgi:DnaK suppressor protein
MRLSTAQGTPCDRPTLPAKSPDRRPTSCLQMNRNIDIEKFRDLLTTRRAELSALIEGAADSAAPVELDQQVQGRLSRMDALQGQAMAQATNERRRIEIAQIDAALGRMNEDEFGYCVECGDEIAPKRLELNPAIARCVECAS